MQVRTRSGKLLGSGEELKGLSEMAARPDIDAIQVRTLPSEAQEATNRLPQFLQRTIGDFDLQRLQQSNTPIANLRIDANLAPQLLSEGATLGIDFNPMFAGFRETQVLAPQAPSPRKYLEGALLGSSLATIYHGIRAASGAAGDPALIALTTFAAATAVAIGWANAESLEFTFNPWTGAVTGQVNLTNQ